MKQTAPVEVSSTALLSSVTAHFLPYSAAKSGFNMFTTAPANETAPFGIVVNAIAPGFVLTRFSGRYTEEQKDQFRRQIPASFLGEPTDIANLAAFLEDLEKPRYIIGQTILVDGGQLDDSSLM